MELASGDEGRPLEPTIRKDVFSPTACTAPAARPDKAGGNKTRTEARFDPSNNGTTGSATGEPGDAEEEALTHYRGIVSGAFSGLRRRAANAGGPL